MKSFIQFLAEAKKRQELLKKVKKSVKKARTPDIVNIDIGSKPNSPERQAEIEYMMKYHGVRALKQQLKNK
jgi:hypothetical protein